MTNSHLKQLKKKGYKISNKDFEKLDLPKDKIIYKKRKLINPFDGIPQNMTLEDFENAYFTFDSMEQFKQFGGVNVECVPHYTTEELEKLFKPAEGEIKLIDKLFNPNEEDMKETKKYLNEHLKNEQENKIKRKKEFDEIKDLLFN